MRRKGRMAAAGGRTVRPLVRCRDCQFYDAYANYRGYDDEADMQALGLCHRWPPPLHHETPNDPGDWPGSLEHPVVDEDDWCGEFRRRTPNAPAHLPPASGGKVPPVVGTLNQEV